jgi:hypothetical protein
MKLTTVYQRQSIRKGGGGGRLEKSQQKGLPSPIWKITQALDVSAKTVYAPLMRTAKLSKKSVKKRFSLEMKKERFRTYEAAEVMAATIP